jgi:hypothetical protein
MDYVKPSLTKEEERKLLDERISTLIKLRKEHAEKGDDWARGALFEEYVLIMFPKENFKLIDVSPKKEDTPYRECERSKMPDLKFEDIETKEIFWVECKIDLDYSKNPYTGEAYVQLCRREEEVENYRKANEEHKVFYVLGRGENPLCPKYISCLDFNDTEHFKPSLNYCIERQVKGNRAIKSLDHLKKIASGKQNH